MRFNIFNQIHKALRALLYDTALTIQQTHFGNPEEAELALEKIKRTLHAFEGHASYEDRFVLPAIQQYEPSMVDAFEKEHEKDHKLSEELHGMITAIQKATDAVGKVKQGINLLHTFNAFLTFNIEHMAKEETVLNERLWRYYSDKEIIAINLQIAANVPQQDMAFYSAWMMKGLSNAEITRWLKDVQTNAPDYVFANLFGIAEKELSYERFRQVLEDLTEGAMVA